LVHNENVIQNCVQRKGLYALSIHLWEFISMPPSKFDDIVRLDVEHVSCIYIV